MKSFIEYWSDLGYSRTEDELVDAMSLFYRLTNLVFSPSFERIMLSPIKGTAYTNTDKLKVILDKSFRMSISRNKYLLQEREKQYEHLRLLETELNVPRAPKRTSICRELSIAEYGLISDFLFCVARYFNDRTSHFLWELRDYVRGVINHLLLRDTLKLGFENSKMQTLACTLINEQSEQFFNSGFPCDFFVHDRLISLSNEHGYWVCYKDRLSTWNYDTSQEFTAAREAKEQNKMLVVY